jgi:putative membrane-bound dehydrogenase-like protein
MRVSRSLSALGFLLVFTAPCPVPADQPAAPAGTLPTGPGGRPLNFDFETGDLRDWTVEGEAFAGQPVRGDTVARRRADMHSRHAGEFWVGSYERKGDAPHGTLTSVQFRLDKPYARFLVGGGGRENTRVEIVRADTNEVISRTSGDNTEDLKPVAVDLTKHVGREVFVRLVDRDSAGWGHLNFDDFTLWPSKPPGPLRPEPPPADVFAHQGLSPAEAAAAMTVPPGFKVTLFAGEPDVAQPIACAFDDRGRLWVAEDYSYPDRVPDDKARDRILIFEDKDGDGRFDSRKVFAEKLNLVSGIEVGFGGVWVGAAPHLLFIPDRDGDDRPDGSPQVLLDGWAYQDTHETLNTFTWGPDGWLYGCHGVFTHSRVGKPGTPDPQRVPINAGVWRYHPTWHEFEVFAHGTSNPWGIAFDERGQLVITACVIPHLYHLVQGGRYERQAGQHFNPYTYDDIKTIADHRHFVGLNPHAGNGRSDQAGGGHAHAGAMIYLGGAWPAEYRGSLFMNNIHGARLNRDRLEPKGSGFVGHHAPDFLLANDRWSQIVSLQCGPDGQLTMIDWYDENQCHHKDPTKHDRTNGRIFKVSYGPNRGAPNVIDPKAVGALDLVKLLTAPNEWHARHARRLLQERAGTMPAEEKGKVLAALNEVTFGRQEDRVRLNALWAIHAVAGLDESTAARAFEDPNPYVRAWAVQLVTEARRPSDATLSRFAGLARTDGSPVVRLYLASALQRLPLKDRWPIVEGLAGHAEDDSDHNLPLMVWYGAEPLAAAEPGRALELALSARLPNLLSFTVRRVSALGTPEAADLLVKAVGRSDSDAVRLAILSGVNEALKGRRQVAMPASWPAVFDRLARSADARVRSQANALALTFGDPRALAALRDVLVDRSKDVKLRLEALAALLKARDAGLPPVLRSMLVEPGLRSAALRGLAAFDDPETPEAVLKLYPGLTPEERRDALNTLASRVESSKALLAAVGTKHVPSADVSADLVRQLRNHKNAEIDAQIGKVWGTVRETSSDKARTLAKYRAMLTARPDRAPDRELGRAVFAKSCQQCHTLFGVGGKVGPELTGSNRADLEYVLSNVLDPSALIGKDYLAHVLSTADGRVLTGIIKSEDKDALTVQTANEVVVVPRGEVEERRQSEQSMMPDDLWSPLSEHEVRSLVAYLASPAQVPMLATAENASGLFNGRDLYGWQGDPALWSVENGEIVGKTAGLKKNEFLRSDLAAEDFRLTIRVKLVNDRGNSGVQFRSVALPEGEVKGYQADVGPGWWGKLYEENGRGLLWPKSGEEYVRPGDWNTYELVAVGGSVRTAINGRPCARLDDPVGLRRGIFALQLHAGDATEVRFKDVRLEVNPRLDLSSAQPAPNR